MTQSIPLITTQDGFEVIRDKIASILAAETAAQQVLAEAAELDPDDWKFLVYMERENPWEAFRDGESTPLVNVWYDTDTPDKAASNMTTRQKTTSRFNIDCYAYAESSETVGGHMPGDEAAALAVHRLGRLVRRILMHDKYRLLDIDSELVWSRWVSNRQAFKPKSGHQPIQHVMGFRVSLDVEHNETIDLEDHETIEYINVKFYHEPDGQVIAELEYGAETP